MYIQGDAEPNQHPRRCREQAVALGEDFDRGLGRAMRQKLGAPIEKMAFVGIQFCRPLIFSDRIEGVTRFFFYVAQEIMDLRLLLRGRPGEVNAD